MYARDRAASRERGTGPVSTHRIQPAQLFGVDVVTYRIYGYGIPWVGDGAVLASSHLVARFLVLGRTETHMYAGMLVSNPHIAASNPAALLFYGCVHLCCCIEQLCQSCVRARAHGRPSHECIVPVKPGFVGSGRCWSVSPMAKKACRLLLRGTLSGRAPDRPVCDR